MSFKILAAAIMVCSASSAALCQTGGDPNASANDINEGLDHLNAALKGAESKLSSYGAQCKKIDAWINSPSERQRSFDEIVSKIESQSEALGSLQGDTIFGRSVTKMVGLARQVEAIESALKRSVAKAEEAAASACSGAAKAGFNPEQIRSLSDKARNLGVVAQGLAGKMPPNLGGEVSRLEAVRDPTLEELKQNLRHGPLFLDLENCGLKDDEGAPIDLASINRIGQPVRHYANASWLSVLKDRIKHEAKSGNLTAEQQRDAEQRLSDYTERYDRIRTCIDDADQALTNCQQLQHEHRAPLHKNIYEEMHDRRRTAADGIRRIAGNIDALLKRAEEAQTRARDCADKAETESATNDEKNCAPLEAQLETARGHFAEKQGLTATKAELDSIQSKLDAMAPDACPDVRDGVKAQNDDVTRMGKGLSRIKQVLTQCNPDRLSAWAERLSQKKHVWLKELGERARLSVAVADYYQQANAAYLAGDMQRAREFYNKALLQARNAGRDTCINIVDRINTNLTKIAGVKKQEDWINKVASSCDVSRIRTERSKIAATAKVSFQYRMMDRLDAAIDTCKADEQEAVEAREKQADGNRQAVCNKDFGEGHTVGEILENGRFFCIPSRAVADAWCAAHNAPGYTAVHIDARGGFGCMPDKQTANAWCNNNNRGSGWYAGEINAEGNFDCFQQQRARKSARRRNPNRRRRNPGNNNDAAAAAAVAGAVIQGIQTLQRNKQARRRCHRNPYTGQVDCGSN